MKRSVATPGKTYDTVTVTGTLTVDTGLRVVEDFQADIRNDAQPGSDELTCHSKKVSLDTDPTVKYKISTWTSDGLTGTLPVTVDWTANGY